MVTRCPHGQGWGLYVHVPFCVRKCEYCDFASEKVTRERVRIYLDALALDAGRSDERPAPTTVYVGGGTPTSLSDAELAELFDVVGRRFDLSAAGDFRAGGEFTVEANPGTVDTAGLAVLRGFGVNRLSLGVQSFRDEHLGLLGRLHTAREAEAAYAAAREAGFENVSVDLMFALPGQTLDDVRSDVARVADMRPEHVSAYGLTYEPGTSLYLAREEGAVKPVAEELERAMYLAVIDDLERAGCVQYEISNFARPGFESRHNTGYWLGREYVGVGPSAASFVPGGPRRGGERRTNVRDLCEYASRLVRGDDPSAFRERLPPEKAAREAAVLGLRLRSGIDPAEFEERTGFALGALLGEAGSRLLSGRWLEQRDGRVRLTRKGLPVADSILAEIV